MEYIVTIDQFEGPFDLLLHLIKQSDLDIYEIKIEDIVGQYFNYIEQMEQLNLNIASEYLVMAAELMEMKSSMLLPRKNEVEDEYEEDPREQLIQRLLDYQNYKNISEKLKELEQDRKTYFTKEPSDLREFTEEKQPLTDDLTLDNLLQAFSKFLERKETTRPLNTKIAVKEYSVHLRSEEIRTLLHQKKKVSFEDLFDIVTRDYVVVTFLSVLDLAKKQELEIVQEANFEKIYLCEKEG